jgi:predicted nuclease with RNAse H fold
MKAMHSGPAVVGVDVGGVKKGFHGVALRQGNVSGKFATHDPAAMVTWCRAIHAWAVGIDAPCSWSLTGRQRLCERELCEAGISAFATPSPAVGRSHPFFGWMLNGARLFRLLRPYYQLFNGRHSTQAPVCFETFPHAVACALAGRTLSAKKKGVDRRRLLSQAGIAVESLSNIDEVDAALCAFTAQQFLAGAFRAYGDDQEGFIVVPRIQGG